MNGLITASRLATWRRCQREHHYRYELGYAAPSSGAQRFGTLVHLGLEAWWRGGGDLRAAQSAMDGDSDPYDLARATAMLIGYDARWLDAMVYYDVLGVEVEFRAFLPQTRGIAGLYPPQGPDLRGVRIGGKLDCLVRERGTGRVFVVEHKTSSEDIGPGSAYWERLRMDAQVSFYHLGGEALGHRIDGVLYDVLGKPSAKPERATVELRLTKPKNGKCPACIGALPSCPTCGGTGLVCVAPARPYAGQRLADETPSDYHDRLLGLIAADPQRYYQRAEVVRLDGERAEYLAELLTSAGQVVTGGTLRNPDACVRYGSACPFFSVCSGVRDIEHFEKRLWPHPELEEDK